MTRKSLDAGHQSKYLAASAYWTKWGRMVARVTPGGVTYVGQSATSRAQMPQSNIVRGDFSLRLTDVREEDAGLYHGRAHYGGTTRKCTIVLTVVKIAHSPQGLLPENGTVNFTCAVVGPERSFHHFRWLRRGMPISSSGRMFAAHNTLQVRSLSRDDQGEWACETDGVRASITLSVLSISGPPLLSVYTSEGSQAELPCNVSPTPAEWPLSVEWSKAGGPIRETGHTLTLSHVTPADAGTYRCDVTYRGQQMTRHVALKVIQVYPQGPTFTREGSPLQLLCKVNGAAEEEQYEWTGPLNSTRHRHMGSGATLHLSAISQEDSGIWVCTVRKNGILGQVEHWLYVHASYRAELGSFSSWQIYVILLLAFVLVFGLATIAAVSFHNRRRRLTHLAALMTIGKPPASPPKVSL